MQQVKLNLTKKDTCEEGTTCEWIDKVTRVRQAKIAKLSGITCSSLWEEPEFESPLPHSCNYWIIKNKEQDEHNSSLLASY